MGDLYGYVNCYLIKVTCTHVQTEEIWKAVGQKETVRVIKNEQAMKQVIVSSAQRSMKDAGSQK